MFKLYVQFFSDADRLDKKTIDIDGSKFKEVIAVFIEESTKALKAINVAVAENDFGKIRSVAQGLKPSIDNMGISSLTDKIRQIETLAIMNQPANELNELIIELNNVLKKIIKSLQEDIFEGMPVLHL